MSERERWIIYPLLFLALGAALRDKLIKQTTADKVICEELWAERIMCGSVRVMQGNQTMALLRGNTLTVGAVDAVSMRQNGQPVLSLSPRYRQTPGIQIPGTPPTDPPLSPPLRPDLPEPDSPESEASVVPESDG